MKDHFRTRRRRSTRSEREHWVQRFNQSGLTQREFAARHQLGLSTLQRWVGRHSATTTAPVFAEVKLPAPASRWMVELARPDGSVVRLAHDAPAALLERLLSC